MRYTNIVNEIDKIKEADAKILDKQVDIMIYAKSLHPKRPIKRILCCIGVMICLVVLLSYIMGNMMSSDNIEVSLNHIITPKVSIIDNTVIEITHPITNETMDYEYRLRNNYR